MIETQETVAYAIQYLSLGIGYGFIITVVCVFISYGIKKGFSLLNS